MGKIVRIAAATALCAAVLVPATAAFAEPDDYIKYRKNVMSSVGDNMRALAALIKGEVPFPNAIDDHAMMMATLADLANAAFVENTHGKGGEKTTANELVWKEGKEFANQMFDMSDTSLALADAAQSGDTGAMRENLGKLGKTCKTCHDKFRDK